MLDPASAESTGLVERLARLDLLDGPAPDPAVAYPVRGALPLIRPDRGELWYPLPHRHGAGGHDWTPRATSAEELRAWRAADGRTTGARVADRAGVSLEVVVRLFAWATDPRVQAGQWRSAPLTRPDPALSRLVGTPRAAGAQEFIGWTADGSTDLTAYHLAISDAATHFDDVETTVAHAHGVAHPGLAGRTYGQALADALGWWPVSGPTLEIGPGDGELAAAIGAPHWIRLDLSPALLAESAARNPSAPGVVADATRLPFRDGSFTRVVANEVMADLAAVPRSSLPARWLAAGLPDRPRRYNLGAFELVAEVGRVLAPGGTAMLSEFGGADDAPEPTLQLDHPEISIHFGDLVVVARAVGLAATLHRLDDLLSFDLSAQQLSRTHFEGLRAMCRADGRPLPARAWTPTTLLPLLRFPVEGLQWVPLSEPGPGPLVTRFWALILRKPDLGR